MTHSPDAIPSHRRRDESRHESQARALTHEAAVLRDCLGIAMRSLTFAALPTTRADLRAIRARLAEAGVRLPEGIEA